ncbi:MAG TPA: hypothetical protein GX530_01980 [Corynebacteriales bacterium]|nr:hypothetical protein [Mycobacteriales bacterium]
MKTLSRRVLSAVAGLSLAAGVMLGQVGSPTAYAAPAMKPAEMYPLVYMSGSNDSTILNKDIAKYMEDRNIKFFEWDPINVTMDAKELPYRHFEFYADSVDAFVKDVLKQTGAKKVNIMTYSQSGLINANWMKFHDGAQYVNKVVNLSGIQQGSPWATYGINITGDCLGFGTCIDFDPYGEFINKVNSPAEALPGIKYYNITTKYEEAAMPYQINLMYGPGDYQNIVLQDYCPALVAGHLMLPHLTATKSAVVQALNGEKIDPACSALGDK